MRLLGRVLKSVVVVAIVLAAVGLLLPERSHVERSIVIHVSPEQLFPYVNSLKVFQEWNPWRDKDPAAQYRFDGPESGVGARVSWRSDDPAVGSGSQAIVESRPPEFVRTDLDFGAQGKASASFLITGAAEGSQITWSLDSTFGYNLIGRYFGLLLDRLVGPDYEAGLNNLKQLAESRA